MHIYLVAVKNSPAVAKAVEHMASEGSVLSLSLAAPLYESLNDKVILSPFSALPPFSCFPSHC